jgi:hypothetical protein
MSYEVISGYIFSTIYQLNNEENMGNENDSACPTDDGTGNDYLSFGTRGTFVEDIEEMFGCSGCD